VRARSLWFVSLCVLSARADRLGGTHEYRWARFPRERTLREPREPGAEPDEDEDEDMDEDDLDEDEDDMLERGWPDRAYHSETSFGYPLDSGDHRICASSILELGA
jgi:hypothetical protein